MKKAFTIAELMVAVAIMAITLAATGWVFKVSIEAQRRGNATAEIMRNYRAITDQIHADFAGLRKDGMIAVWVRQNGTGANEIRADRIWFTANGDFQTSRQYPDANGTDSGRTVWGNVAIITYAMSESPDPLKFDSGNISKGMNYKLGPQKMLARRQTIFTSDTKVQDPCASTSDAYVKLSKEYLVKSLSEWRRSYAGKTFNSNDIRDMTSVTIDVNDANQIPMLLAKGVEDFSVEILDRNQAFDANGVINWIDPNSNSKLMTRYPLAMKISFTLYSKTLVDGKPLSKRFTQIIDLKEDN